MAATQGSYDRGLGEPADGDMRMTQGWEPWALTRLKTRRVMKRTARWLCVVFFSAVYVQGQSADSPHSDRVDDYIKREMPARNVPGLAFAVMENGRVIREGAYGLANVESGAQAGIDTVFDLASSTKPITAGSLMMVVGQKHLTPH